MFKSIKAEFVVLFLLVGLLPCAILAGLGFWQLSESLERQSFEHLTSIREIKKHAIEDYFAEVRRDVKFLGESPWVKEAMHEMSAAFHNISPEEVSEAQAREVADYYQGYFMSRLSESAREEVNVKELVPTDHRTLLLQHQYLHGNEHASTDHSYAKWHDKYHGIFAEFQQRYGYYDIFLVDDRTGHIVYSVFKETDLGTSLLDGPHASSNIGRLFRELRQAGSEESIMGMDFEPYLPSYLFPGAFMAAPIIEEGQRIGTLICQISIDEIDRVMTGDRNWESQGFGKSGESYILGEDYRMRNDSRFIVEDRDRFFQQVEDMGVSSSADLAKMRHHNTTILYQEVRSGAAQAAMSGLSETRVVQDYRGIDVLSSYTPLNIPGMGRWVLLAEIDVEEAFADVIDMRRRAIILFGFVALAVGLVAWLIARKIARPVIQLHHAASNMSQGDLSARVPKAIGANEIAQLSRAFNKMAAKIQEARNELLEQNSEITAQSEEIRQQMEEIEAQRDSLLESNETVNQQKEEIMAANEDLNRYGKELQRQNQSITASINYAQRLQQSILPPNDLLRKAFDDSFVIYMPKNIVSGDFYWYGESAGLHFISVADCTGHGVPGAFMSMLGMNLLKEIILLRQVHDPAQILHALHDQISQILRQKSTGQRDSIDLCICCIDYAKGEVRVAGAKNSVYSLNSQGKLSRIRGDRFSVGGEFRKAPEFNTHTLALDTGLTLYLTTDGLQDQFGGPGNTKFSPSRLRKAIVNNVHRPFPEQKEAFLELLSEWRQAAKQPQIDDITLIALHISQKKPTPLP